MGARKVVNGLGQVRWIGVTEAGRDVVDTLSRYRTPIRYRWRWMAERAARRIDRDRKRRDWRSDDDI